MTMLADVKAVDAPDVVEMRKVALTPALAEEWLSHMKGQRRLNSNRVQQFILAIERGEWLPNPLEPIGFTQSGSMCQGQHRCAAVAKGGKEITVYVVRGVEDALIEVIDQVRPRSIKDQLDMRGESYAKEKAAAAAYLLEYERTGQIGHAQPGYRASNTQGIRMINALPGLEESARLGKSLAVRLPISSSLAAALHYVLSGIDAGEAEVFFRELGEGASLKVDSPILQLRERLFKDKRSVRPSLDSTDKAALTFKVWNLWRKGHTVSVLIWRRGGATPESFPVPS